MNTRIIPSAITEDIIPLNKLDDDQLKRVFTIKHPGHYGSLLYSFAIDKGTRRVVILNLLTNNTYIYDREANIATELACRIAIPGCRIDMHDTIREAIMFLDKLSKEN